MEFLVIANHAEAKEGLLYLSGACWTDLWRSIQPGEPPPATHMGIGVAILVPWLETNRKHHLVIRLESEDGKDLARVEADLEVGRPPGIPEGVDQRSVLALNGEFQFPAAGGYRVVAQVAGDSRSVSFRVHDRPRLG
jgi:hypothetical protein